MSKITAVKARQILDSRGNPTVECALKTTDGIFTASVPSGASTGVHEALELRDGGSAFMGKGVLKAVKNINTILAKKLAGKNPAQQAVLDRLMIALDGTQNKKKLGANAILAVSMALARAGAGAQGSGLHQYIADMAGITKQRMPVPAFNIINGGKHAGNNLDIQEYMLLPTGAKSFAEALQIGSEVYHDLKKVIEERHGKAATNVGDEGGFAPPMHCFEEPFDEIMDAVQELGYYKKIKLGIDAAATTFFKDNRYYLENSAHSGKELAEKYLEAAQAYPLISLEDPFAEDDFTHFAQLTKKIKGVQIVGDDLTVTNPARIKKAVNLKACTCLLLKINQIGTITEALEAARLARKARWNIMVSHRSGETTDDFIADLAVGLGTGQIKAGAPCRGERLVKYNKLVRIEQAHPKLPYGGTFG